MKKKYIINTKYLQMTKIGYMSTATHITFYTNYRHDADGAMVVIRKTPSAHLNLKKIILKQIQM